MTTASCHPREVTGDLTVRHVATLDYDQYLVDGTPVDPKTIVYLSGESDHG
jgi:hypothetical protein